MMERVFGIGCHALAARVQARERWNNHRQGM